MTDLRETHRQSGFTLIELIIVSSLIVIMAGAVTVMANRGTEAQQFVRTNTKMSNKVRGIVDKIRDDVASSVRLLYDDSEGKSYLKWLDLGHKDPIGTTRLPVVKSAGFGKDATSESFTGNCIAFVKQERTDKFDVSSPFDEEKIVRTDIYRIYVYYLHKIDKGGMQAKESDLDLVRWRSVPLIDWKQQESLTNAARERLLQHLYLGSNPWEPERPYPPAKIIWETGKEFTDAFRLVDQDGDWEWPPSGFKLPAGKQKKKASLLQLAKLGVARNKVGVEKGIARFTHIAPNWPNGFEVQIAGPASARQVLMHFTLVGNRGKKMNSVVDLLAIAETRDL